LSTRRKHSPALSPRPEHLARYDTIVPGAAARILQMAEQDAEHQRAMERNALAAAVADRARGQFFGLAIGLGALGAAVILGLYGNAWAGTLLGGSTIVGLVTVFVVGRKTDG
jgi:uncharacterized membrane protein